MTAQTEEMPREFENREQLIAYLRATFPHATRIDDHVAAIIGGRKAALDALEKMQPRRYAESRNYLNGAVNHLSPYIRHGVLSLAEVRDHLLATVETPREAEALLKQLAWRDYFQRIYATLGDAIWQEIEEYKTGVAPEEYANEVTEDIRTGTTGLLCIDSFAHDLAASGYLHNHARLWLAAYIVHWRRIRWQAGARWFLEHLLDGDPASNNLSWQWVASTFGQKPYFFNRENLERFTNGLYCEQCPLKGHCDFEASYEELQQRLFRPIPTPETTGNTVATSPAQLLATPSMVVNEANAQGEDVDEAKTLVWVHGDNLNPQNPALTRYPAAPALWVWDDELLAQWRISFKRILFIYECLQELPVVIQRGAVAQQVASFATARGLQQIVTVDSPSPKFHAIVNELRREGFTVHILETPSFTPNDQPYVLKRFSKYWQQAQKYLDPQLLMNSDFGMNR